MSTLASNSPLRDSPGPLIAGPAALVGKFNAVVDAVVAQQPRPGPPRPSLQPDSIDGFWARINGSTAGVYGYVQIHQTDPGTWEDVTAGFSGTTTTDPAREVNLTPGIADGTRVWMNLTFDSSGKAQPIFAVSQAVDTFFAKITSHSGAAHAWTEQTLTAAQTFADATSPRSGTTTTHPAYELNGRAAVATGTIVRLTHTLDSTGGDQYSFDLGNGLNASEPSVGSSSTADAPLGDSWNRESPSAGAGVKITIQSRTTYNASGDKVLYGYFRTLTFDSNGQLKSVSVETRVSIDTPDAC